MADTDKLRPEVREAVHAIDHGNGVFVDSDASIGAEKWRIVLAELLRLADGNARMRGIIETLDMAGQRRADRAEAELAALKARIAEAPIYEIPLAKPKSEDGWARVIESVKNERSVRGKRVRLVVEK